MPTDWRVGVGLNLALLSIIGLELVVTATACGESSDDAADGGADVPVVASCTSGEARCVELRWEQCSEDGTRWSPSIECSTPCDPFGEPDTCPVDLVFASLAAGRHHTCGIDDEDTLWCWGFNQYGQIGVGTTGRSEFPRRVGSESWQAVACGDHHTCGIRMDGTLWCWGHNNRGQLGLGDDDDRSEPAQVGTDTWLAVDGGRLQTCALDTDEYLWCWGATDPAGSSQLSPVNVDFEPWSSFSSGGFHTCGIQLDGSLWCWGSNISGEVGDGTRQPRSVPVRIGEAGWRSVVAGDGFTCAIAQEPQDDLWCWGDNSSGQFGDGTMDDRLEPTPSESPAWQSLAAGDTHMCGVQYDQSLWCWGDNAYQQLGLGLSPSQTQPRQVGTESWQSVVTGQLYTCALSADGTVWCWGDNPHRQFGSTRPESPLPVQTTFGE